MKHGRPCAAECGSDLDAHRRCLVEIRRPAVYRHTKHSGGARFYGWCPRRAAISAERNSSARHLGLNASEQRSA
jgi:hypothetical protein